MRTMECGWLVGRSAICKSAGPTIPLFWLGLLEYGLAKRLSRQSNAFLCGYILGLPSRFSDLAKIVTTAALSLALPNRLLRCLHPLPLLPRALAHRTGRLVNPVRPRRRARLGRRSS